MSHENLTKPALEGILEIKSQQEIARAEEQLHRLRPKSATSNIIVNIVAMVLAGVAFFYAEDRSGQQTGAMVMLITFALLTRSEIDNRRTNKRIDALWLLVQKRQQ